MSPTACSVQRIYYYDGTLKWCANMPAELQQAISMLAQSLTEKATVSRKATYL